MTLETLLEKSQLEGEVDLLSLSLNWNGCKYKEVRPMALGLLKYML